MASAFSKLFLPGHRKRLSFSAKRQDSVSTDNQQRALQNLQPATSGRKSFASARPSFQGAIQEESSLSQHTQPAQLGLHRSALLTTESLNAAPPAQAGDGGALSYQRRDSIGGESYDTGLDGSRSTDAAAIMAGRDGEGTWGAASITAPIDDDDDDLDTNPIYLRLSEDARLAPQWDAARLVLVPLRRCMPIDALSRRACLEDDAYIALHALRPSQMFKDRYVSVLSPQHADASAQSGGQGQINRAREHADASSLAPWSNLTVTATLLPDQRAANVIIVRRGDSETPDGATAGSNRSERKLRIVAETTVYRTVPPPAALQDSAVRPSASPGFEVLSRHGSGRQGARKQEQVKVRVVSIEDMLIPPDLDLTAPGAAAEAEATRGAVGRGHPAAPSTGAAATHLQPATSATASRNVSPSGSIAFPSLEAGHDPDAGTHDGSAAMSRQASSSSHQAPDAGSTLPPSTGDDDHSARLGSSSASLKGQLLTLSDAVLRHFPQARSFPDDLLCLLSPSPELCALAETLSAMFDTLLSAALRFTSAFVFLKGFEKYNVGRVRGGIFDKACDTLREQLNMRSIALSSEAMQRLHEVVENVALGCVHAKMYGSTANEFVEADNDLDEILALYVGCGVGLVELGVHVPTLRHRPGRLESAVAALRDGLSVHRPLELDEALESADRSVILETVRSLGSDSGCATNSAGSSDDGGEPLCTMTASLNLESAPHTSPDDRRSQSPRVNIRTPVETLQALKATIDEIGMAVHRSQLASSRTSLATAFEQPPLLSTDDLLPVLAYIIVKARPEKLVSCLHYAKAFKLIDVGQSDLGWALVTFEVVVEYLKKDPLRLRAGGETGQVGPVDAFGFRLGGGTASRHGSIGDASMRSLPSRQKAASGSIGSGYHYHTVSMSRQSSDSRDRRASMPLGSPDGTWSPTSPLSPALSSAASFAPGGGGGGGQQQGYFPQVDPAVALVDTLAAAFDDNSPPLKQEGFRLPGLPASSNVLGRPSSRASTWNRPRSFYSNADGSVSRDGLPDSPGLGPQPPSLPLSRQSSTRSRTISLNAGGAGAGELQIRPQIVRSSRRMTAASVSQVDLSELGKSRDRSGGSISGQSVRVVGSPPLSSASPPKANRRKSMDSWTALSLFGGGRTASSDGRASLDLGGSDDQGVQRRAGQGPTRPLSLAESIASSEGNAGGLHPGNASTSSLSWLPWSTEGGKGSEARRPETPGTSSIASAEGVMSSASTYSSMGRSGSGSGFASIHATMMPIESSPPAADVGAGAGVARSSSLSRRTPSIRSTSSHSSAPGSEELPGSAMSASVAVLGQLQAAQSTSQLRVPNRKRYRARFLSNAGTSSSAIALPSPPMVNREATTGDIRVGDGDGSDRRSLGSLSAVMASNTAAAVQSSSTSTAGEGTSPTQASEPSSPPMHGQPLQASVDPPRGTVREDRLIPPFFRLQVPSPVHEIADPLSPATPSPTLSMHTHTAVNSPVLDRHSVTGMESGSRDGHATSGSEGDTGAEVEFDLGIFTHEGGGHDEFAAQLHRASLSTADLSRLLPSSHSTFKRRAARGGGAGAASTSTGSARPSEST